MFFSIKLPCKFLIFKIYSFLNKFIQERILKIDCQIIYIYNVFETTFLIHRSQIREKERESVKSAERKSFYLK